MVAPCVICVVSDRHEVAYLCRKPVIEEFRLCSNEITADEDIQYTSDE